MFRSVITAGQAAVRSSLILNGAAAVAVLAFIGHLAKDQGDKVPLFAGCLLIFSLGALAIVMTAGFTYLSQWLESSSIDRLRYTAQGMNYVAIVLGFGSHIIFLCGLLWTFEAFSTFG